MPSAGVVDRQVASTAYATARKLGASDKVMLALFEAGLVESGFRNQAVATDHDSLGFLQQRPSQGWGTPAQILNVEYATTSFVNKAKLIESKHLTAGGLAQGVQRSAFPLRYDARAPEALGMIAALKLTGGSGSPVDLPGAVPIKNVTEAYEAVDKTVSWISDSKNVRRIATFGLGVALIAVGVTRFGPVRTAVGGTFKVTKKAITKGAL